MALIIHADDFGMARSINQACRELCRLGTMSSVSIMANMPFSGEAVELLETSNVSLGVHSTFTEGAPLLPADRVSSLVDGHGNFHSHARMLQLGRAGRLSVDDIHAELSAQCARVRDLIGGRMVFLDSHHSIHNKLKPFAEAFLRVKDAFGFTAIRTRSFCYFQRVGEKTSLVEPTLGNLLRIGLKPYLTARVYAAHARRFARVYRVADAMIVTNQPGVGDLLRAIIRGQVSVPAGRVYYLVIHPATATEDLPPSNLTKERVEEYAILRSPEAVAYFEKHRLIHFGRI